MTGIFVAGVAVVVACAAAFEIAEYRRLKKFQAHLREWAQTYIDQMNREETGNKS